MKQVKHNRLTFTIILVFFVFPCVGFACTCEIERKILSLAQKVRRSKRDADAVFIGKVVQITENELGQLTVRMKVVSRWKGSIGNELTVLTGAGNGDCGFPFQADKEYLVYASAGDHGFTTNICSRTSALPDAQDDLRKLGKVRKRKRSSHRPDG